MARVTYGALITALAGSIGGITFQNNSSGSIARLKPNMPVNPSVDQAKQQKYLIDLTALWSALSSANKTTWDVIASAHDHTNPWGIDKTLNGFQWFISCNLNRKLMSLAVLSTAPAWGAVSPPSAFTFSTASATFSLVWSPALDTTGQRLFIYATPPIRQSSTNLRRSNFLILKRDNVSAGTVSIKSVYESQFNITWSDLYANSNCTIIVRARLITEATGYSSVYTSGILKLN